MPLHFIVALHCSSKRCTIPQSLQSRMFRSWTWNLCNSEETTRTKTKVFCCGDCINRGSVRSLTVADYGWHKNFHTKHDSFSLESAFSIATQQSWVEKVKINQKKLAFDLTIRLFCTESKANERWSLRLSWVSRASVCVDLHPDTIRISSSSCELRYPCSSLHLTRNLLQEKINTL